MSLPKMTISMEEEVIFQNLSSSRSKKASKDSQKITVPQKRKMSMHSATCIKERVRNEE